MLREGLKQTERRRERERGGGERLSNREKAERVRKEGYRDRERGQGTTLHQIEPLLNCLFSFHPFTFIQRGEGKIESLSFGITMSLADVLITALGAYQKLKPSSLPS